MTLRGPAELRQRQKSKCDDIQKTMPTQNNSKQKDSEEAEPEAPTTKSRENAHHARGRPRPPEESGEDAKGTLTYEMATKPGNAQNAKRNTHHLMHEEQLHM